MIVKAMNDSTKQAAWGACMAARNSAITQRDNQIAPNVARYALEQDGRADVLQNPGHLRRYCIKALE